MCAEQIKASPARKRLRGAATENGRGKGEALAEELFKFNWYQKGDESCDAHMDQTQLLLAEKPTSAKKTGKEAALYQLELTLAWGLAMFLLWCEWHGRGKSLSVLNRSVQQSTTSSAQALAVLRQGSVRVVMSCFGDYMSRVREKNPNIYLFKKKGILRFLDWDQMRCDLDDDILPVTKSGQSCVMMLFLLQTCCPQP